MERYQSWGIWSIAITVAICHGITRSNLAAQDIAYSAGGYASAHCRQSYTDPGADGEIGLGCGNCGRCFDLWQGYCYEKQAPYRRDYRSGWIHGLGRGCVRRHAGGCPMPGGCQSCPTCIPGPGPIANEPQPNAPVRKPDSDAEPVTPPSIVKDPLEGEIADIDANDSPGPTDPETESESDDATETIEIVVEDPQVQAEVDPADIEPPVPTQPEENAAPTLPMNDIPEAKHPVPDTESDIPGNGPPASVPEVPADPPLPENDLNVPDDIPAIPSALSKWNVTPNRKPQEKRMKRPRQGTVRLVEHLKYVAE